MTVRELIKLLQELPAHQQDHRVDVQCYDSDRKWDDFQVLGIERTLDSSLPGPPPGWVTLEVDV